MQWQLTVIIVVAGLVSLFLVVFIGVYSAIMSRRRAKLLEKALPDLTCSLDNDCPPGFMCMEGRCVPQKA